MEMTFDAYIDNPMGKKNMVISQRSMFRDLYTDKLDKIILRENRKFIYKLYHNEEKDLWYCHIKVPSEVVSNFYYDTVLEFYPMKDTSTVSKSLSSYGIRFYSNDPAFVFTFAHSFLKNQVFIKDLVPRMSKEAVTKAAKTTNPGNQVGYVKSIYFAYLIMKRENLFLKANYLAYGEKYNQKTLLTKVEHADTKVSDRQEAQKEINDREKDKKVKEAAKKTQSSLNAKSSKQSAVVKTTKNTKTVSKTETTKFSKKTKM